MPRRVLNILVENFEVEEDIVVRTSERMGFGDWRRCPRCIVRAEGSDLPPAAAVAAR